MDICEIPRWQQLKQTVTNLDFDEFIQSMQSDDKGICLDVRTPEEYAAQHLKGALNLNYLDSNLADQLERLDKQRRFYVYCRTGRRSLRVCVLMKNMNLESINLEAGCIDRL